MTLKQCYHMIQSLLNVETCLLLFHVCVLINFRKELVMILLINKMLFWKKVIGNGELKEGIRGDPVIYVCSSKDFIYLITHIY